MCFFDFKRYDNMTLLKIYDFVCSKDFIFKTIRLAEK